MKTEVHQSS